MPLAVDVAEDAFSFVFTADVPGVQRSAVKVRDLPRNDRNCVVLVHLPLQRVCCSSLNLPAISTRMAASAHAGEAV